LREVAVARSKVRVRLLLAMMDDAYEGESLAQPQKGAEGFDPSRDALQAGG